MFCTVTACTTSSDNSNVLIDAMSDIAIECHLTLDEWNRWLPVDRLSGCARIGSYTAAARLIVGRAPRPIPLSGGRPSSAGCTPGFTKILRPFVPPVGNSLACGSDDCCWLCCTGQHFLFGNLLCALYGLDLVGHNTSIVRNRHRGSRWIKCGSTGLRWSRRRNGRRDRRWSECHD